MRRLDPNRESYQVFGYAGVHREQDGILFNAAGNPVIVRAGQVIALRDKNEPEPEVASDTSELLELRQMAKIYSIEGADDMSKDELQKALEGV